MIMLIHPRTKIFEPRSPFVYTCQHNRLFGDHAVIIVVKNLWNFPIYCWLGWTFAGSHFSFGEQFGWKFYLQHLGPVSVWHRSEHFKIIVIVKLRIKLLICDISNSFVRDYLKIIVICDKASVPFYIVRILRLTDLTGEIISWNALKC